MKKKQKTLTFSTAIEGEIARINTFNYNDLKEIRTKYRKCYEDSKLLQKSLLKKLPEAKIDQLNKTIVAVDGSVYIEEYNSIVISLALAYVYTTNGYLERYLPEISVVPPYYSTLVNSLIMKTLEYQIVIDLLNEDKFIEEKPDLILFDGPLSFPDEAMGESIIEGKEVIIKYYNKFKTTANSLFDVIKERNIPTIGLIKDTMSNKYFLSLINHLKNDFSLLYNKDEKTFLLTQKEILKEILNKWDKNGEFSMMSESVMIKNIFQPDKVFTRTFALPLLKGFGLRANVPINNLRNGNLLGCYVNVLSLYKAFFFEFPKYFEKDLEEILKIFTSLCYFSLKPGYPMPLFAAHKKVELNKRKSKRKLTLIKYLIRTQDPDLYKIIFESKFHPAIE